MWARSSDGAIDEVRISVLNVHCSQCLSVTMLAMATRLESENITKIQTHGQPNALARALHRPPIMSQNKNLRHGPYL